MTDWDLKGPGGGDMDGGNIQNATVLDGVAPSPFICPSNRMVRFSLQVQGPNEPRALLSDYAGIAGADGNDPLNRYDPAGVEQCHRLERDSLRQQRDHNRRRLRRNNQRDDARRAVGLQCQEPGRARPGLPQFGLCRARGSARAASGTNRSAAETYYPYAQQPSLQHHDDRSAARQQGLRLSPWTPPTALTTACGQPAATTARPSSRAIPSGAAHRLCRRFRPLS